MMNKLISILVIAIVAIMFASCEKGKENHSEIQEKTLIDECFLVRGDYGELLDLHIVRDKNNNVFITTSLSNANYDTKSTHDDIPDYIIIAKDVEFSDNTFVLPETNENYLIFDATLGDPIASKSVSVAPGIPGGGATISVECNCLSDKGKCAISCIMNGYNVFTATCKSSITDPCEASGIGQCQWTLPTITVHESVLFQKSTKIIIESNNIDYNGILYE